MTDDRWIIIPKWDEFQHRDAGRGQRTVWLRDYARQLDQDEYRDLTFHQRGLLRDLRHSYATTHGQLRDNSLALTRRLGQRVFRRDLEALNHAGYIQLSASKPPALGQQPASLEVEVESTKDLVDQAASENGHEPDLADPQAVRSMLEQHGLTHPTAVATPDPDIPF